MTPFQFLCLGALVSLVPLVCGEIARTAAPATDSAGAV
jgi:hypothetical protein